MFCFSERSWFWNWCGFQRWTLRNERVHGLQNEIDNRKLTCGFKKIMCPAESAWSLCVLVKEEQGNGMCVWTLIQRARSPVYHLKVKVENETRLIFKLYNFYILSFWMFYRKICLLNKTFNCLLQCQNHFLFWNYYLKNKAFLYCVCWWNDTNIIFDTIWH